MLEIPISVMGNLFEWTFYTHHQNNMLNYRCFDYFIENQKKAYCLIIVIYGINVFIVEIRLKYVKEVSN